MLRGDRAFAAMAFAVLLLGVVASGCNCSNNKCGPGNCPGCCDSSGTCQGGFLPAHCGADGAACTACSAGTSCTAGHCGIISSGGGTGTGGGVGTGGGGVGTGGGGFGVGGGAGGGAGTQFCTNYASAYCDYVIRCGMAASSARTDCINFLSSFYCSSLKSVNKGYETLNTTNATACINYIQTVSCDQNPSSGSAACNDLVSPNSSTGQGCFSSADCKTASDGCGGSANACMLVCEAPGPLGAPCPCNDGLRCDYNSNTCANPHNVGEMCRPYVQNECVSTAICDSTSMTCVSLPGSGPCYQGTYCAPTAYCDFNTTTCQPRVGQDQTCQYNNCAQGLWCNYGATGGPKCQPLLTQGSMCNAGDYSCASGLACLNNLCEPLGGVGAQCVYYSDCQSTLECDSVLHTCQKYNYSVPAGGACTDSTLSCAYPNACHGASTNPDGGIGTQGTCGPPMLGDSCYSLYSNCPPQAHCELVDAGVGSCVASTHGSPCGSTSDCLTGDYCGASQTCVPKGGTGSPCYGSGSCASGLQCVTQTADGGQAGLCGTLGGLNATCAGENSCLFPYTCIGGHCTDTGHASEPCLNGFLCFDGACQQDAGTTGYGLCNGAKRADGQPCFYPTDCQSGNCVSFSVCGTSCP